MTIKATSELNSISTLVADDLFKVSQWLEDDKYASKKLKYEHLSAQLVREATDAVSEKWQMKDLSVSQIDTRLSTIESVVRVVADKSGDTPTNVAVFSQAPVSEGTASNGNQVPNREQVIGLVQQFSDNINSASFANSDPDNANGNHTAYLEDVHQYHWHIDNNTRDSAKSEDKQSNVGKDGGVIIRDSGYLTIYGWVACNAEVLAQEAWVALYGKVWVKSSTSDDVFQKWIALQVQPFVVGKYAQAAQYVGFNIPVKAGIELKIMTGFNVNGTASGLHTGNTLMFTDRGNMPNSFVGYVTSNTEDF